MSDQSQVPDGLLIFSIGPVQDFIAAARRTQDLWMGSFLLAYLASRALKAMQEAGATVLYPSLKDQPLLEPKFDQRRHSLATLPNKFTITVSSLDEGEVLARQAEKVVRDAWQEIIQAVHDKFPNHLRDTQDWEKVWRDQTRGWLEVYWAVTPRTGLPTGKYGSYGELHNYAQRAFDARKGLRNFDQAEERGEKCTVCAIRAALRRATGPRSVQKRYWGDVAAAVRQTPGLFVALDAQGNERLCAICTVKRFAHRFYFEPECSLRTAFPSTSSVATALFRRDVLSQAAPAASNFAQALQQARGQDVQSKQVRVLYQPAQSGLPLLDALSSDQWGFTHYDGDLLFEETYSERKLERDYGLRFNPETLGHLQSALNRLLSQAGLGQPPRYYAVLAMDGDRMGEKLNQMQDSKDQKAVSEALRLFAVEVQQVVEDGHGGRVVYAGGDDVLALLPVESALTAADDLRQAYERVFQRVDLADKGFTLSGSIAIAYHQAPLGGVLTAAREAEHAAKNDYNRNALCVVALKRSGEPLRVGAHWQEKGKKDEVQMSCDIPTLIDHLRQYFKTPDALSSRFAYEAHAQAHGMALSRYHVPHSDQPQVIWEPAVPPEALQSALHRLAVQRHRGRNLTEADASQLARDLRAFAVALDDHWHRWIENWYQHHQHEPQLADLQFVPHPGAEEMGHWVLLARFLERGGEE
jgi:CRISPR-associated protein Cmr2